MTDHPFVPSGTYAPAGGPRAHIRGRRPELCLECSGTRDDHRRTERAAITERHRARVAAHGLAAVIPPPEPVPAAPAPEDPWPVVLLRIAVAQARMLPEDAIGGWRVAARVEELHALLTGGHVYELPTALPVHHAEPEPAPAVLPERAHRNRKILRGIRSSDVRAIIATAIDAGWECGQTSNGMIRCAGPAGAFSAGVHAGGRGRDLANLRAAARRAGLEV